MDANNDIAANFSPRQERLLRLLAEGITPTHAAAETGYCIQHAVRLSKTPAAAAEIQRLRREAAEVLAEHLPQLTEAACMTLRLRLASGDKKDRLRIAEFVLKHLAFPAMLAAAEEPSPTAERLD